MKKFYYSLQKVLNLREFYEKEAEIALGKAISARDAIQLDLSEVAKKRVSSAAERKGSLRVEDLLAIEHFIQRLDIRKEELLKELTAAELVLEQKRILYLEATKNRQVLTKLKEKKESVWHKEYLNSEAAILDDIVNFRSREI
ncbi:MAG TPA: flagellar export protein FliJ [Treponemataceae bacterium]|nr:flagellar export protein FliJ [Treponemataceae bacterium]